MLNKKRVTIETVVGTGLLLALFLFPTQSIFSNVPSSLSPAALNSSDLVAFVYPNPIRGEISAYLHIESGEVERLLTQIYTADGTLIYQTHIDEESMQQTGDRLACEHKLDVHLFHSGTYAGVVMSFFDGKLKERKKFRFSLVR